VDINGDGLPDVAYAGDNQGNMWKFDLTSADASNWGVALAGLPLFTATGPASLNSARTIAQPITAPPTVRANDRKMTIGSGTDRKTVAIGGMMVAFGTGAMSPRPTKPIEQCKPSTPCWTTPATTLSAPASATPAGQQWQLSARRPTAVAFPLPEPLEPVS
jgi:hypothetical protein